MKKVFRIGDPMDLRQNRLEVLYPEGDFSSAIEDIEPAEDEAPTLLIEDAEEGEGVALSQDDFEILWPYLQTFRESGSIGAPVIDLDTAEKITTSVEKGHPYIHVLFGKTIYHIFINKKKTSAENVANEAAALAKQLTEPVANDNEKSLTPKLRVGIAVIRSTKAEKWETLAEALRNPTASPETMEEAETYY